MVLMIGRRSRYLRGLKAFIHTDAQDTAVLEDVTRSGGASIPQPCLYLLASSRLQVESHE